MKSFNSFETHFVRKSTYSNSRLRRAARVQRQLERSKTLASHKGAEREYAEEADELHAPVRKGSKFGCNRCLQKEKFARRSKVRLLLYSFSERFPLVELNSLDVRSLDHILIVMLNFYFEIVSGPSPRRALPGVEWMHRCVSRGCTDADISRFINPESPLVRYLVDMVRLAPNTVAGRTMQCYQHFTLLLRAYLGTTVTGGDDSYVVARFREEALKHVTLVESFGTVSDVGTRRLLGALRVLLLIAGIEPNPGPEARDKPQAPDSPEDLAPRPSASVPSRRGQKEQGPPALSPLGKMHVLLSGEKARPALFLPVEQSAGGKKVGCQAGVKGRKSPPIPVDTRNQQKCPKQKSKPSKSSPPPPKQEVKDERPPAAVPLPQSDPAVIMQRYDKLMSLYTSASVRALDERNRANAAEQKLAEDEEVLNVLRAHGVFQEDGFTLSAAYSFFGTYRNLESTYDQPGDTRIDVAVGVNYELRFIVPGCCIHKLYLAEPFFAVAALASISTDHAARMRNIRQSFLSNKITHDMIQREPMKYGTNLDLAAFLLAGWAELGGGTRFLNDMDEWVPEKYTVEPPTDWKERLVGYSFAKDMTGIRAKMDRKIRRLPFYVEGACPDIPDYADFGTMVSGICKRLEPDTPAPGYDAKADAPVVEVLRGIANELTRYIQANWQEENPRAPLLNQEQLCEEALRGRPLREKQEMLRGIELFNQTYDEALSRYLAATYSYHFKLENYIKGSKKPPRFIASLPLWARGVQVAAMSSILQKIERGTFKCNVKHMTADQITERLVEKFEKFGLCIETDFSSFESCITPVIKGVIENNVFLALADTDEQRNFIRSALMRSTVAVKGPGFYKSDFHHIRMSGDLWTSIGNLLTNIVILTYVLDKPLAWVIEHCLFEGDDGMAPSPTLDGKSLTYFGERAANAGMLLKFDEGNFAELSFCGNHNRYVNGRLVRSRDSYKTLTALVTWFGCDPIDDSEAIMLQRSKCVCALAGPWVPGASAFAALVEYLSRGDRVKEKYLERHGMMKEYSSYGVEACVPGELAKATSDGEVARFVAKREWMAGGAVTGERHVKRLLRQLRETGHCDLSIIGEEPTENQFEARVGLRREHAYYRYDVRGLQPLWRYVFGVHEVNEQVLRHSRGVSYRARGPHWWNRLGVWWDDHRSTVLNAAVIFLYVLTALILAASTTFMYWRMYTYQRDNKQCPESEDPYAECVLHMRDDQCYYTAPIWDNMTRYWEEWETPRSFNPYHLRAGQRLKYFASLHVNHTLWRLDKTVTPKVVNVKYFYYFTLCPTVKYFFRNLALFGPPVGILSFFEVCLLGVVFRRNWLQRSQLFLLFIICLNLFVVGTVVNWFRLHDVLAMLTLLSRWFKQTTFVVWQFVCDLLY